jgi:hypothetical protein
MLSRGGNLSGRWPVGLRMLERIAGALVVGGSLLYPPDDDVAAAVDTAVGPP